MGGGEEENKGNCFLVQLTLRLFSRVLCVLPHKSKDLNDKLFTRVLTVTSVYGEKFDNNSS